MCVYIYIYLFCFCLVTKMCSTLCNPWTVACQAPLSMEFPRQAYWSGLSFHFSGDLPNPGIYQHPSSKVKVAQLFPTLCEPMDYTVHGILQARIPEWVAIPFGRFSWPRDQTQVSCIAGRFFTSSATRETQEYWSGLPLPSPGDLPDPGIELGSPALQGNFLPVELPGKL